MSSSGKLPPSVHARHMPGSAIPPPRSTPPGSPRGFSRRTAWHRRRSREAPSPTCTGRRSSPPSDPCRGADRPAPWRSPGCRSTSFLAAPFALIVDGVLRDFDREVRPGHLRLAGKPRGRLEAPCLVEHVLLLFLGGLERLEPFPQDHVAGGARRLLLAGMLDVDMVLEQRVADGLALRRLDLRALRTDRVPGQHLQIRHQRLPILRPASARRIPSSMRRAANSSVARFSASLACLIAR